MENSYSTPRPHSPSERQLVHRAAAALSLLSDLKSTENEAADMCGFRPCCLDLSRAQAALSRFRRTNSSAHRSVSKISAALAAPYYPDIASCGLQPEIDAMLNATWSRPWA